MRALVTGATGFIGGRLAARLAARGDEVHAFVRPGRALPYRLHEGDMNDPRSVAAAVEAARPEVVFHLAKDREARAFEADVRGTLALAAALRGTGILLVRTAHNVPRGADARLAESLGVRHVTLELYQVYGPGQPANHFPADLILGGPGRPEGPKDFVFVEDVVEAYLLAAERGVPGRRYEIGSGVLTDASAVAAMLGRSLPAGAGEGHAADLTAARELGWRPRTSLDEGLRRLKEALVVG